MSQQTQTTSPYVAFTLPLLQKGLRRSKDNRHINRAKKEVSFIYKTLQNITSTKNRSCVNCPDGKPTKLHATQLISQR